MLDLTVIVPTTGRATLAATLDSIPFGAEVLVIADGDDAMELAAHTVGGDDTLIAVRTDGTLGHPQRNLGMKIAESKWLAFMDDDDVYVPGAFDTLAANLNGTERPHIFQMRYGPSGYGSPAGHVLWERPELEFGNVGTPMFVVPNLPGRLGTWPSKRGGDYDFIRDTVALQGDPVWVPEVIAEVRPAG